MPINKESIMTNPQPVQVVFDTRSPDFANGTQYYSLIDQVNAQLKSGTRHNKIEITQWELYEGGKLVKGDSDVHVPIHRHFYVDDKNAFGGGFMLFELFEDLRCHYEVDKFAPGLSQDFEMVYTITVTPV